jgi:hypothetical protein
VAPAQQTVDDLLLARPETVEAKDVFQHAPLGVRDVIGLRFA